LIRLPPGQQAAHVLNDQICIRDNYLAEQETLLSMFPPWRSDPRVEIIHWQSWTLCLS